MGRHTKQGIEYFPVDTRFDDDLQLLIADIGAEGLGILITIWQAIYNDHGYYIEYDEKFPLKIKQRCFSHVEKIVSVVENAIKHGLFNLDLYKNHKILTSRGIQKRFFTAARWKKKIDFVAEYGLIDLSHVKKELNLVKKEENCGSYATYKIKQNEMKLNETKQKEIPAIEALVDTVHMDKQRAPTDEIKNLTDGMTDGGETRVIPLGAIVNDFMAKNDPRRKKHG